MHGDVSTQGESDAMLQVKQAEREAARQARLAARAAQSHEQVQREAKDCLEGLIVALEDNMLEARYAIARRRLEGVDPSRELYSLTHSRMYKAGVRGVSVEEALGCTLKDFADYIESHFMPGMTWQNRGRREGLRGWELDHIRPLSCFILPDEWHKVFHHTNVQPLWYADNMRKSVILQPRL